MIDISILGHNLSFRVSGNCFFYFCVFVFLEFGVVPFWSPQKPRLTRPTADGIKFFDVFWICVVLFPFF